MAVASLVARVDAQVAEAEKNFERVTKAAVGFERAFASSATSVAAQQKRINDAFQNFSGDRLAREAGAVAKAVEKLGGASKLTAAEQANVNAKVTEAIAKYSALGQVAPKALLDLEHATRKVDAATAQLPTQLSLASKAAGVLGGAFGQFTAAGLATNAIQGLIGGLGQFVAQAQKLPAIQNGFERLAAGVKVNAGDMLSSMRAASLGLVSDLDLMQAGNKALLLGLPVTASEMGNLAATATALGRAMGLDATTALDNLIVALGRSSPLILDNLGLTVRVEEANQLYADSLGRSVQSLTEAEKKTAFYNAAMEKARAKTAELGEQTLTLSEIVSTAWTAIGNRVTGTVSGLNVTLGDVVSSGSKFGQFLQDSISRGVGFATSMAQARVALKNFEAAQRAASGAGAPATQPMRDFVAELKRAAETMPVLTRAGEAQFRAAKKLGATTEELTRQFGLSVLQQQLMAEKLGAVERAAKQTEPAIKKLKAATEDFSKLSPGFQEGLPAAFANVGRQARLAIPDVERLFAIIRNGVATTNGITGSTLPGVAVPLKDVVGDLERAARAAAQARQEWDNLARSIGAVGELAGGEFGATLNSIADGWLNAAAAVKAYTEATTAAGKVAAIVQQGAAFAQATGAQSRSGATLGGAAAGAAIGANPALVAATGGLSIAVGALAGAIVGFVRSAGQGREAVVEFAKEFGGFDGLREKLNALGAEGERLWVNLTQGVGNNNPQQAAAAIAAIQEAFTNFNADPIGAAIAASGFKTRAQLEELAATATSVYERMRDSGEFTAGAVQQAFERMQEAQTAAFGDTTATDSLSARVKELTAEYDALFKSIENEAPEAVMGDVEKATRARMEAIRAESEAAQAEQSDLAKSIKDGFAEAGPAAKEAADAIGDAFKDVRINIPIQFIMPDTPTGVPAEKALSFTSGSSAPRATSTSASTFGGSDRLFVAKLYIDGREAAEAVVPHIPGAVRRRT